MMNDAAAMVTVKDDCKAARVERVGRIPLGVKLVYTAFMAVMVPYYWSNYGPRNFLYFCDAALLLTLAGMWLESPLIISMQALAIMVPQMAWVAVFLLRLAGFKVFGLADYMFNPQYSLFVRGLSLFHGWMPFLLLWLVSRVGYDRRALPLQIICGVGMLLVCCFAFVPPSSAALGWRAANINCVFGLDENKAQMAMPPLAWLGILVVGLPVVFYLPMHLFLRKLFANTN
jgi:hypothetical protein